MGAAAGIALQVGGSLYSAYAQQQAGAAQKALDQYNAKAASDLGVQSIVQGEAEAGHAGTRGRELIGEQRASYAGQGVDVNSGSAAAIQQQTADITDQDISAIRVNAMRQAWGYETQAQNFLRGGNNALNAGNNGAIGTLLTGAGQAAQSYANYKTLTSGTAPTKTTTA